MKSQKINAQAYRVVQDYRFRRGDIDCYTEERGKYFFGLLGPQIRILKVCLGHREDNVCKLSPNYMHIPIDHMRFCMEGKVKQIIRITPPHYLSKGSQPNDLTQTSIMTAVLSECLKEHTKAASIEAVPVNYKNK